MRARTKPQVEEFDEDDGDLLQPALDSGFDVRRFKALFDPTSMFWPCFLGGPIACGLLLGLNYRNMNMRRMALWVWVGSVLIEILAFGLILWVTAGPGAGEEGKPLRSIMRVAHAGGSVFLGWYVGRLQRPQFQAFINARRHPRRLFWPGVGAILVGLVSILALVILGALVFAPEA